jgi:hypothetical protein
MIGIYDMVVIYYIVANSKCSQGYMDQYPLKSTGCPLGLKSSMYASAFANPQAQMLVQFAHHSSEQRLCNNADVGRASFERRKEVSREYVRVATWDL